jgi:hypothetical protein
VVIVGWSVMCLLMLGYVVRLCFKSDWDIHAWGGMVGGLLIGGLLTLGMMLGVRKVVNSPDSTKLTAYIAGGFLMKLLVAAALAGVLMITKAEGGESLADPYTTLLSYLAMVFLGFAWQAKLLEAPATDTRPGGDSPEAGKGN